ncbi:MAG: DUF4328 domain-containing protein [Chloroflexi bacterium]|nr:MAG: DUF4328 domain-containing protein [Chloroflexota bacterium]
MVAAAHTRARLALMLLGISVLAAIVGALSSAQQLDLVQRIVARAFISDSEIEANDARQMFVGLVQTAIAVVNALVFLVWVHGARKALDALGLQGLRFGPRWSIGWFFVPFANLIRPPQIINDIWKGSDPQNDRSDPTSWRSASTTALVPLWWGTFLVTDVVGNILLRQPTTTVPQLLQYAQLTLAGDVAGVFPPLLAFLIVQGIDRRQTACFALRTAPAPISPAV